MITEYFLANPTLTINELEFQCKKATENTIQLISVPPLLVKKAKNFLDTTNMRLSSPIGYPYGWSAIEAKLSEIILAIVDGIDEVDFYINITALKNKDWQYLAKELNMVLNIIRKQERHVNIVADIGMLTNDEITKCCDLYGIAGVNCLTVNYPFNALPDEEVLELVRSQLADNIPLKAFSTENINISSYVSRYCLTVK